MINTIKPGRQNYIEHSRKNRNEVCVSSSLLLKEKYVDVATNRSVWNAQQGFNT